MNTKLQKTREEKELRREFVAKYRGLWGCLGVTLRGGGGGYICQLRYLPRHVNEDHVN
jgi:hypothetical protein